MNYFKHLLGACLWLSAVGFIGCHDDVEDTSAFTWTAVRVKGR